MLKNLTPTQIDLLQKKYFYLVNYEADDPTSPINPLTYTDSGGDHLLHIAAQRGDLETVQLLVAAGVDVNLPGDMGSTALHYATGKRHTEAANFLLSRGASMSVEDDFGRTPHVSD